MVTEPEVFNNVSRAIQLALAPVFLLTGIAGMLNVMSGRLSRIIDRSRALTGNQYDLIAPEDESEALKVQLQKLEKRRHYTSIAITACTIAALLVCTVVATLFIEVIFEAQMTWLIITLFIAATLALVVGLAFFLREVHISAQTIRITFTKAR